MTADPKRPPAAEDLPFDYCGDPRCGMPPLLTVDVRDCPRSSRLVASVRLPDGTTFRGSASHLFGRQCAGVTVRELAIADALMQAQAAGVMAPGPPAPELPRCACEVAPADPDPPKDTSDLQ